MSIMKVKGITIWEQYVEFFVLVIAAVVFIGFTAMQFVGNPNEVSVNGNDYAPGNVDQTLQEVGELIAAGLAPEAPSPMNFPPHEKVLPEFKDNLTNSVVPGNILERFAFNIPVDDAGVAAAEGKEFIEPTIRAPYKLVAKQSADALRPEVVEFYEKLNKQERFLAEPYDVSWVTVAGKFNVAEVLQQFSTPGPDGELAFQERWYNGRVDILDVRLEREEYLDGVWGNLTMLEPIPGQKSFREQMQLEDVNARDRDKILGGIDSKLVQNSVIRPDFLGTVGDWIPPNPDAGMDEEMDDVPLTPEEQKISILSRRLRILQQRFNAISASLEEIGGELEPPDDDRSGGGNTGGGGGGSGAGGGIGGPEAGGGGGRGMGGAGGANANNDKQRISLTLRKRKFAALIDSLKKKLADLGALIAVNEDVVEETPDELVVWAHDMTVERGRTYRYRLSVDLYNPMFARKLQLPEQQHKLADNITLASAKSEWTKEIHTDEWLTIFVTQASGPGSQQRQVRGLMLGEARADVFRFQHGRWWKESFSVEPGDRIGRTKRINLNGSDSDQVEVDFSTEWFLVDVIENIDASREDHNKGLAATAMIQSYAKPELLLLRDPNRELLNRTRLRLEEEVDLADLASEVALSGLTN